MLKDRKDIAVLRWLCEDEGESAEKGVVTAGSKDKPVPGDVDPKDQVHIFDFDDTLGVTKDSNGIMLYNNGMPAWKTQADAQAWATSKGFSEKDLLKGPKGQTFEQPEGMDGFAAYVSSGGLAKARSGIDAVSIKVAPYKPSPEKDKGDSLVVDYSPSASAKSAVPIPATLDKLKSAKSSGSPTEILTARTGESIVASGKRSNPTDFAGKQISPSVEADLKAFMADPKGGGGTVPDVIKGLGGGNKGDSIKKDFFDGKKPEEQPKEIHFYDDDGKNISDVNAALSGKVPAEVFLYGPGEFAHNDANPSNPNVSSPASAPAEEGQDKKPEENPIKETYLVRKPILEYHSIDTDHWRRMAGIKGSKR